MILFLTADSDESLVLSVREDKGRQILCLFWDAVPFDTVRRGRKRFQYYWPMPTERDCPSIFDDPDLKVGSLPV